jgi:broad specificity phosphatase PhoE
VIHVIEAKDVPKADKNSESDPLIKIWLEDENGRRKSEIESTLARSSTKDPVWDSYLCLALGRGQFELATDRLHIEVYDVDYPAELTHDRLIAETTVAVVDIHEGLPSEFEAVRTKAQTERKCDKAHRDKPCMVSLRRQPVVRSSNYTKRLFLIRHGESAWNKGKDDHSLMATVMKIDHPLTAKGVEQAQQLNSAWKAKLLSDPNSRAGFGAAFPEPSTASEESFFNAELVLVSPLCRAFQTAVVSLDGHPTVKQQGVTLLRTIREIKKSSAGNDCRANKCGHDVSKRVQSELGKIVGLEEAEAMMPEVDLNDTRSKWWTEKRKDGESDRHTRVMDFLSYVEFLSQHSAIVVGHSNFFHDLVSRCLDPAWAQSNRELGQQLTAHKV